MSPSPYAARFRDAAGPVIVAVAIIAAALVAVSGAVGAAEPVIIYGDEIGEGYQNWSWADVDMTSTDQVHHGSAAMSASYGPWEGLYLAKPNPTPLDTGQTLEFWMHGGSGEAGTIQVVLVDGAHNGGSPVVVQTTPGQWSKYQLPIAEFGFSGAFGGLWWQNASANPLATIYIDDVRLVGGDGDSDGDSNGNGDGDSDPAPTGPELTVELGARSLTRKITDPASNQVSDVTVSFPHQISDGVYGLNFAAPSLLRELAPGVNRWGGNAVERFNYLNGTTNLGKDWFFMNNPGEVGNDHRFETANSNAGADTLLTVPAIGWVSGNDAARCGYPLNRYAPMDNSQPHFLDRSLVCGDGRRGGQIVAGRPETTSTPVGPAHTQAWVTDLVQTHGSAANGGVEIFAIGNEPGLWHETHSDVVAEPMNRQGIIATNIAQATAIKGADPTAAVAGPVLWGGFSYFVTSSEFAAGQRPADVPTFTGDYLAAMAQASDTAGRRLLDTLAINFYDDRVFYGGTDQLRLESTRNLWDPSYAPDDWWVVRDFVGEGNAVIPRMKSLIDNNYPGTELSITEYNFGGLDTLAGGLTQADALGIFGREGLDRAMLWDPFNAQLSLPEAEFANTPAMWAYRMYRNYDGAGSRFGDRSLFAESSDQDVLSIYAAERSTDEAVTIMVINKSTAEQTSRLDVGIGGVAEVYNYGQNSLTAIERRDDVTVDGSIIVGFPARSITLFVIDPEDATTTTTTTPTTTTTTPPTTSGPEQAFFEDFADNTSFTRFEAGIYHRDDWVVTETSWMGDHQPTGQDDACGSPFEKRLIERGDRDQGFNQDWIYRCRPDGKPELAHLMTSIGDTSGYSIGAFTPNEVFSNVTEIRWDVNITDLGTRQFPEVKVIPVDTFDFQNLPCSIEWLPCLTDTHADLGSVGTSFFHAEPAINNGSETVKGYNWDSGWRDTGTDPARQSIMTRRTHFFRDNGDGTLTFGIETEDGDFETISAPGSFPDGDVRVVFADHNYTPRKDEPADITFTWHWDNLGIITE